MYFKKVFLKFGNLAVKNLLDHCVSISEYGKKILVYNRGLNQNGIINDLEWVVEGEEGSITVESLSAEHICVKICGKGVFRTPYNNHKVPFDYEW